MQVEKPVQEENFETSPYNMLLSSVRNGDQVIISLKNNKKIMARVKAFDRHLNLILEDAIESWTEKIKPVGGKSQRQIRERIFNKLFLRGDSIVFIVKEPLN